jgi:hypothetical protein
VCDWLRCAVSGGRLIAKSSFHRTLVSVGISDGSVVVATGMRADAPASASSVATAATAPAPTEDEAGDSEAVDTVAKANDLPACIIAASVDYFNTLMSLLEGTCVARCGARSRKSHGGR